MCSSDLLFLLGILLRGASIDPAGNPDSYAAAILSRGAAAGWFLIFIGMVLEPLGLWALSLYLLERGQGKLAYWGMVLSVLGVTLVIPLIGFTALAAPVVGELYQAGQTGAMGIAAAMSSTGLALIVGMISGLAYSGGSLLTAIALWRQGVMPKALVIAFALQAPLLSIVALFSVVAELVGAVGLFVSVGWLVWHARQ